MASGGSSGSGGAAGGIREQSHDVASSSSASVSTVGEGSANNLNMVGGEDMKKVLECPICIEILVSPIYQCRRGHTICNTCKPKLTKCPSCREAPFGDIRNLALESILQTMSFSCNHHHKGCNVLLKIQNLQQHHEECDYRPLKCHLSDMDDCNGSLLHLSDTLNHLRDTHKLRTVNPQEGHSNVFISENCIWFGGYDEPSDEDPDKITWPGELFHFDEHVFVALMRCNGPVTYFGFYLIGPESDASKYSVKISIQKDTLEDAIFKIEVTTQFTSIRDFQEVWEEWKLPHEAIVHDDVLRRDEFFPGREIDEDHGWGIVYTINKI